MSSSFLYSEIHDQPAVLARLLEQEASTVRRLAESLRTRHPNYVLIAARDTRRGDGVGSNVSGRDGWQRRDRRYRQRLATLAASFAGPSV